MAETFGGIINREVKDSTPWWPEPNLPDKDLPNIVTVLLDDTGFAHLGCFGSPIDTPNFDALAARGLRYNNFHTTALCSPSRACLLTGRNHHSVGMRAVSNFDTGFPNMRGRISASAHQCAKHRPQGPLPTGLSSEDLIASTALCRAKRISFTPSSMLTTI